MKESHYKTYMRMAFEIAKNSYCERAKVGCVIVTKTGLLSVGYNGTSPGRPNVCECDGKTKLEVRHAERNALNKFRNSTETSAGGILFVTLAPCFYCALDIVEAGITELLYGDTYETDDGEGLKYLVQSGVNVRRLPLDTCVE